MPAPKTTNPSRLRIIVTGLIAQYPLGGVAWDYLQYPLGLARLGHDVYYVEDTGQWPYNPHDDGVSESCEFNVSYLAEVMARFGLENRWAYRFAWDGKWRGLQDRARNEVIRTADLIINVSGTLRDPQELDRRGVLCYIDSDPVFTQAKLARGQADFRSLVDGHDVQFSFGETLSDPELDTGHTWIPTRQPVVLDEWRHELPDQGRYTTVMNWTSYSEVRHNGRSFGQKDIEFRRFIDLPKHSLVPLEVAMASGKTARAPVDLLRHRGWSIVDPAVVCPDLDSYRHYLQTSRGEWSVAKNGYVAGRSGWFSCRSACYLAAGRPVIAQDTGFSEILPVGDGLLAFTDLNEAAESLKIVEAAYEHHARTASELASAYFDSDLVLGALIERASSSGPGSFSTR